MTKAVSGSASIPFARPSITEAEKRAVLEVLESGWITTGPRARAFEESFAAKVGSSYAVALNSATAGLHLALEGLGVGPGDEVIVPTWTFAASAEVVSYVDARPVLVDVDPRTLNATVDGIEEAITPRTRAVIAVHIAGLPTGIEQLAPRLRDRGISLVEDAAHAFPSRVESADRRYAGTFGNAGAYSFYATKTITTGEGGMLVTDDGELAKRARLMSLHGIDQSAWGRYHKNGAWYYEIVEAGFKYNMTDIAAALGLAQLERAEELLEARRHLAQAYTEALAASSVSDLIEPPAGLDDSSHAWHLYIIRLALDRITIDRARVIDSLRKQGISTSVHFIPLHLHPYHQRTFGYSPSDFPVASREYERAISLPIWPGMSDEQVATVVRALDQILHPARR